MSIPTTPTKPLYLAEEDVFWGEVAPTEHILHLYSDKAAFFRLLEGFVLAGLKAEEAVIVIATPAHRAILNESLQEKGIDLRAARDCGLYVDLSAENCLATFMKDGWPDEQRFNETIGHVIAQVKVPGRRIRAFGEMVTVLWNDGHSGATVRLEHLWNEFRKKQPFSLFCSYPKAGFTVEMAESLEQICAAHTKVILDRSAANRELASA